MLEQQFGRKPESDLNISPADEPNEGVTSTPARPRPGLWQRITQANWSLIVGVLVLVLVVGLALLGPILAPRDPLEQNAIVQVGEGWKKPPFQAFQVPGFPLGTDRFGRDLLSRLLWAIRPTMTMIAAVAIVRLVLGTLIGLGSGWSSGWLGRGLNTIIAGALSVPVLMVALAAIAALGTDLGLSAFVIGLSLTGWADTAQLVREQTRLIKGKLYVEAAHALGASGGKVLFRHVLRQVMPMLWMLFAFEISGTMMVTAGLAFLGYYIGGDIWVDVDDWVARRISGDPELGQMLAAASQDVLGHPWTLVAVGSMIFIIVLGFNLLGQGLRARLSLMQIGRDTLTAKISRRANLLFAEHIVLPIDRWSPTQKLAAALISLLVLLIGGGLVWHQTQSDDSITDFDGTALEVPGGHLWAASHRDPYGTRWVPGAGPNAPDVQWTFHDPSGFPGGPAVAADGTVYIASSGGRLYALRPDGDYWLAELPAGATGTPGLSAQGEVYVADENGGLSAFDASGELLWHFEPRESKVSMTGPIVAPNGTVYYPVGNNMQAVSSDGELLWETRAPAAFRKSIPQLSPQGELLFWEEVVFDAHDGSLKEYPELEERLSGAELHYFVGADGRTYLYAGSNYMRVQLSDTGAQIFENVTSRENVGGIPEAMGVTPGGGVWIFFTKSYVGARDSNTALHWKDLTGKVLGETAYPYFPPAEMIAIDQNNVAHVCGQYRDGHTGCVGFEIGAKEPLWSLDLEPAGALSGGALVPNPDGQPGRLYVTLEEGYLYALGAGQPQAVPAGLEETLQAQAGQPTETPPPPTPTPIIETVTATVPVETPTPTPTPIQGMVPGQAYTYTLTVANNGPSDATGVVLTDTLPAGAIFESATASQGFGCAYYWPNVVACYLGNLPNGVSATVVITITPTAELTGVLTNTAVVVANQFDPEEIDNVLSKETPVEASADLALSRSSLPAGVAAGDVLTYTLTVLNDGPAEATEVSLSDQLPEGTRIRSFSPVSGTACTIGTQDVSPTSELALVCDLGRLPRGASVTLTNVVQIDPLARGTLDYSARVTAREPDPNPSNDVAKASTTVAAQADLIVDLRAAGPAVAGQPLTYTLTLTNAGPADALGLVLTDVLPLDAILVQASLPCREMTGTIVCQIDTLPSGEVRQVYLVLAIPSAATGQIRNQVLVGSRETDPNPADNAVQIWTTVETQADLSIRAGDERP